MKAGCRRHLASAGGSCWCHFFVGSFQSNWLRFLWNLRGSCFVMTCAIVQQHSFVNQNDFFSLLSSQRVSRMETLDSRSTARGTMFVMKIIHFVWVHQFSRWNSFSFFFKFVLRCSPEFQILFLHYLDFSIFFLSLRALWYFPVSSIKEIKKKHIYTWYFLFMASYFPFEMLKIAWLSHCWLHRAREMT